MGRVGSGQALRGSGRVWSDNWLLKSGRVGSGPDPGRSGRVRKIGPGNNSACMVPCGTRPWLLYTSYILAIYLYIASQEGLHAGNKPSMV